MVNGVAVALRLALPRLRQLGFEVELFAPRYHGYQDPEDYIHRWPSVAYMKNPPFYMALPVGPLLGYLRSQQWDVIHFHTPLVLGWVARTLALRRGLPLVYTYHTTIDSAVHYSPFRKRPDSLARIASPYHHYWCDRCSAVVAPSRKVERILLAEGVKAEVRQINYGIDLERFNSRAAQPTAQARAGWGLPAEAQLVLYVGRLGREKNIGFLLSAFARLVQDMAPQPVHFVLAGDGNERGSLEQLAAELKLSQATTFLGNVSRDRLPDLYRLADLFVWASKTEAQGVVTIEAIAAGLPVVAAHDEALEGIACDGLNARIVNLDLDEFTAACRSILTNGEQRAAMRRASQAISETFSIDRHVQALGRLYTDVVERGRANGRAA
jgi:glycosyltransferase involved in cell wall biosynthesis